MGERAVRVPCGDDVHQARGQASRDLKDLRLGVARRKIRRALESIAAPARMRRDDDHFGARRAELRRLGGDRGRKRRDPQSLHVGGERQPQRIDRHDADDADFDAGGLDEHRRPDVRPLDRRPGRGVNQIRGEERIARVGGARLERASRVARQLSRRRRVDGPEIEIVVADGLRGVPHRVVRVDDEGAFAEIRFGVSLKCIAGVEQQDRAAVGRPGRAQVVHVAREQRQAAEAISRKGRPVEIAGADNRQGHKRRSIGSGTETGEARRPDQADEQQPKPAWHRPPGGYTRLPRWPFAHRDC